VANLANKSTIAPMEAPEEWSKLQPELLRKGTTVFLLGGVDTGKTYLARFLLEEARKAGLCSSIIELDVGQAEFGPPMTNTLAMEGYSCHYFIGQFSPDGVFWKCLTAAVLLLREAKDRGSQFTIIDPTGLVDGPRGIWFKRTKIELLRPDYLLFRQRSNELESILSSFSFRSDIKTYQLALPQKAIKFSSQERAFLRQEKLKNYFRGAEIYTFKEELTLLPDPVTFRRRSEKEGLVIGLIDERGKLIALALSLQGGSPLKIIAPKLDFGKVKALEAGLVRIFDPKRFII